MASLFRASAPALAALATLAAAVESSALSMWPTQFGGKAIRTEVRRSEAARGTNPQMARRLLKAS